MSLFHMHRRASEKPEFSAVFVVHTTKAFKSRVISAAHNGTEHNNERIFERYAERWPIELRFLEQWCWYRRR